MRFAKETVWATTDGKLVKAGDPKAAFLVAAKNHPVHDKKLEQYSKSDVSNFFKDASFDRHGSPEAPPPIPPPTPAPLAVRLNTVKETKADANAAAKATTAAAATVSEKRAKIQKASTPKSAKTKKAKKK